MGNIAASEYKTNLLYITCGDQDEIAMSSYERAVTGTGNRRENLNHIQVLLKAAHDFGVWYNGATIFSAFALGKESSLRR